MALGSFVYGAEETVARKMTGVLKSEYAYSPDPSPPPEPMPAENDVVVMETFTVVESGRHRRLAQAIEKQELEQREQRHSIVRGGTLLTKDVGKVRIELGTWDGGLGVNFLRISW